MTIWRRTLIARLCVAVVTAASAARAQAVDTVGARWTLRASPELGLTSKGGALAQTSAWVTWDRLAFGLRTGAASTFLGIFSPSYELREQSALVGLAHRKGHRTSLFAVGVGRTTGHGGYDTHCFITCGSGPAPTPTCIAAGDPSNFCVLTPHAGIAAAAEFGLHFTAIGIGTAFTYVKTTQVEIAGAAFGLQVGYMPARRP